MDFSSSLALHAHPKTVLFPSRDSVRSPHAFTRSFLARRRFLGGRVVLVPQARAGPSPCEFSSSPLNTPLEPNSPAGKFLSRVLLNQRQDFNLAVSDELKLLANDRDAAISRMFRSSGSDEAPLHRRISQLKERECQAAVEDVMYMLIIYKFSEIRVPLVPKLSRCTYNGRLEIWPAKDWELESIHSFEVLEMIKEHISTVIGLRANCSVTDCWATTEIQRLRLGRLYAASLLYGYFLKSASLRHCLEECLASAHQDLHLTRRRNSLQFPEMWHSGLKSVVTGRVKNEQSVSFHQAANMPELKQDKLKCYVMGFDPETLQRCAKLRSKEAENLIENHSCALFGDGQTGLVDTDEVILTSFSSLKRLVLEAIAFGSFLWDVEEHVDAVYKLKEK